MPRKLKALGRQNKRVNLTLPPYIYTQLEKLSKSKYVSKSVIVTMAIEHYARAEEKQNEQQ